MTPGRQVNDGRCRRGVISRKGGTLGKDQPWKAKEKAVAHHVQETHYLRVFMASLRRKIEEDSAQPRSLLTEAGVGYRLAAD